MTAVTFTGALNLVNDSYFSFQEDLETVIDIYTDNAIIDADGNELKASTLHRTKDTFYIKLTIDNQTERFICNGYKQLKERMSLEVTAPDHDDQYDLAINDSVLKMVSKEATCVVYNLTSILKQKQSIFEFNMEVFEAVGFWSYWCNGLLSVTKGSLITKLLNNKKLELLDKILTAKNLR